MKRTPFPAAVAVLAGLLAGGAAHGYSATASVTFTWASAGTIRGWTADGTNSLGQMSNGTYFSQLGGTNSTIYVNADFAQPSDYGPGTQDDCLTPLPQYESITLRKYGCRHTDASGYYSPIFVSAPATDLGPSPVAAGALTVTDTTMTGILTVVPTTDEPTGGTTTSAGDGASAYNMRAADGSPFGNAWWGISTGLTLNVNLTGNFTATNWSITGGTVRFSDPGFQCQQGGLSNPANILCLVSTLAMGSFSADGSNLSWGADYDGGGPGTVMTEIEVRNVDGSATLATLSGVLASLSVDGAGNITTNSGEFRGGRGFAACTRHLRWDGTRMSCGNLNAADVTITGVAIETGTDDVPDPFSFPDRTGVSLSALIVSDNITPSGFNAPAAISVISGEYSIGCNGAGFTNQAGTLQPGQTVCVRHLSSSAAFSAVDTLLTIGGVSATFTSTTGDADSEPDPFVLGERLNVPRVTYIGPIYVFPAGFSAPTSVTITGGNGVYAINCNSPFTTFPGTIGPGQYLCFYQRSSPLNDTETLTTLTIGGVSAVFRTVTEPGPFVGGPLTYTVNGTMAESVNACINTYVTLTGADCGYARTRSPAAPSGWQGPAFAGGFYRPGSNGDDIAHAPVPADGKYGVPMAGTVTIDDSGTPLDGSDDVISANLSFGAGAYNAGTGASDNGLERWSAWLQEMPPTVVSAATPTEDGGYRYVIGSRRMPTPAPLCAQANSLDCFPSENAPAGPGAAGFWSGAAAALEPATARSGIERSPGFGEAGAGQPLAPNAGVATTGSFTGYECVDQPGDDDCATSPALLGTGAAGFDNVVLLVTTNGNGAITSADAYWTREFVVASGPVIGTDAPGSYVTDNSWVGGRFNFAGGIAGVDVPRANTDEVTVQIGESVTIDMLANDTGLSNTPLSIGFGFAQYGSTYLDGNNRIVYTPHVAAPARDYFGYSVRDSKGLSSSATIRVNIVAPVGPKAIDDNITSLGFAPAPVAVLDNDQRLSAVPLSVTVSRQPYDGAVTVSGSPATDPAAVILTYRASHASGYSDDSFEYTVTDADGYSDTATVSVYRYPKMAQDDSMTAPSAGAGILYPLQNDLLPYEAPLYGRFNVGIYRMPAHGTVTVSNSGGYPYDIYISYTADPGYIGPDSFEYAVDNEVRLDTATVSVTVVADRDGDGVLDATDNCTRVANANQRDTNGDGFGNRCDADLDNNGFVNFADLAAFRNRFTSHDADADFDGNGIVNFADLAIFVVGFGKPPGPAGALP